MSERKEAWFRLLVVIVTGIILWAWGYLAAALTIIHWLYAVFSGKRSKSIGDFVEYWNSTAYTFYRYVSGVTNERPFPFTPVQHLSKFQGNSK